ncbi:conserved hypothetical protein [Leishmania major strain Friedlin]|uniref:Uncharacterized protein n=1 Tax=Leishmania major TaxID=5664 RepID=Q4Q085_LEIMA|nr:conserved hypothetical protein [Leishmania major strain Friedlin]CAG9584235.1 hypothetical_protein_-_conserved [Leishmania major strain Friedlin]CAJ09650.1 conserved hypothetical protein [Leishmania major strain Friedlin]|eukprot:XP_001687263.1 conserved hypothetical protein [Leishmania major strain Friedlin]
MADLRDELDATALFGSGYVCIVGPPSSGKTTLILEYLVARERQAVHSGDGDAAAFCMEYVSARSAPHELLRHLTYRLLPHARRRRLSYECTPLEFSASLVEWVEAHPGQSELHLVVDDADALEYSAEEMNLWLSHYLRAPAEQRCTVILWLISELPLRLSNCFRYHFIARPEANSIVQWLHHQFEEERRLLAGLESEEDDSEHTVNGAPMTTLSADEVNRVVLDAFTYYATHQPMCSSVVSRDVRLLVQRVYQILPPLLLEVAATTSAVPGESGEAAVSASTTADAVKKLNARHFAAAWSQYRSDGGGGTSSAMAVSGAAASAQNTLVMALKRLGYSAVLLAFAAFYGGAVPKRQQHQVFGRIGSGERQPPLHEAKGQSHKAAVLTASAHVVTLRRLGFLYDAMLRMCTPHIDPLEFTTADVALQYVQGFVAWGLLTPVVSQRHRSYHCWIPVSTAQQLARELSLSLFDLIPA